MATIERHPAVALSRAQARSACARAAAPIDSTDDIATVLGHLSIVQLDSINALARAHALTLASRLSGHTIADVDEALWSQSKARVFEYWGHAASLIPIEDWPLWAFRRRGTRMVKKDWHPDRTTCDQLRARILTEGPLTMRQLRADGESGSGWDWSPTKRAVEYLIWAGELICARRAGWQRLFDLPERIVPAEYFSDSLTDAECICGLLERVGHVLGVAAVDDFADYIRIRPATVIAHLSNTNLVSVQVEGVRGQLWAHPDALESVDDPAKIPARFVGPFDNLIWYRKRVSRMFEFEHVLEAYKPAVKRQYGYYVCPLLVNDRLIGRADLALKGGRLVALSYDLDPLYGDGVECLEVAMGDMAKTLGVMAYDIVGRD